MPGKATYLVIHVEGGNIQAVYPDWRKQKAIQLADSLWDNTDDQAQDDVRVFEMQSDRSPSEGCLNQIYMPATEVDEDNR